MILHLVNRREAEGNIHLSRRRSNTTPVAAQASDAETHFLERAARHMAEHLRSLSYCRCMGCLAQACDFDRIFLPFVVSAVENKDGYPVWPRTCEASERQYGPATGI